jgi:regulator of replication initiation timing
VIREDTASEPAKSEPASPAPSDDGFSRFYNTFGSLFNRLPLPLVFSGLPLISEDPTPAPIAPASEPPHRKSRTRHSTSAAEPDLSKIYSRATLRSLERDGPGTNDSFYVVPTSGHTASYASILNHERKEKRRMAASIHSGGGDIEEIEDEDDFVDARESQAPAPLSPTFRKRLGKSRSEKELRNVIEELHLENASLKDVLDKLSKRLHAFELNSQSSHLALAQSLRLQRPDSPTASGGPAAPVTGEEALRRRNRELEEQLGEMVKRMQSLEKDHLKLQLTVEKYRERWEQLKADAKARRAARGNASDGESRR